MTTNNHNRHVLGALAAAGAFLLMGPQARADSVVAGLGDLATATQIVVVGVVSQVGAGPAPGLQLAEIAVEESILGSAPALVSLAGDLADPSSPAFTAGDRVLVFLKETGDPQARRMEVVEGERGVVALSPESLDAARGLAGAIATRGTSLGLADLRPYLTRAAAAPPGLLAASLREAASKLTKADTPEIASLTCDVDGALTPAARLWAVERAGAMRVLEARGCLEAVALGGPDTAQRLAAARALGEIGDAGSVPVLLALLEPLTGKPEDRPSRRTGGGLVVAAVEALGAIGDPSAVPALMRLAFEGDGTALHGSVVHALGRIGGVTAIGPLTEIAQRHPNPMVRDLAARTLAAVRDAAIPPGGAL